MSDYGPLPRKSLRVGLGWWLVLGLLGAHRFYLRDYVVGTMYVATLGFLGVGWVVDLFLLSSKIREWNLRAHGAWLDTREALEDRIEALEDQVDDLVDELESRDAAHEARRLR